ncbi:MAG: hypothetical protein IRY91_13035 [Gemmatimonadaceae bacterium]|nr:hypothetical protein [Gemmatimonadaceae bacterium]
MSSMTVYRFASAGPVTVRYSLDRRLATAPRGSVRFVQISSATVLAATTPWASTQGTPRASAAGPTAGDDPGNPVCDADFPVFENGTYCGVDIHFIQAVPADAFQGAGAQFQSDPGHGQSHPITITFSKPATEVTITIYDPTWDGNTMAVYDTVGNLVSFVTFAGNHAPGVLTVQVGHAEGAIARIVLTPADGDYVAYSMRVRVSARQRVQITSSETGLLGPTTKALHIPGVCNLPFSPSRRRFTVKVLSDSGVPLPNRTVTLTLTAIDNDGGHVHAGDKPVGSWSASEDASTTTVTTDASGGATVTLIASEFGGRYIITGTSDGARDGVDTVTVGIALEGLGAGDHYRLIGEGRDTHPDAYNGTPTMVAALRELADSVYANFDQFRIGYNDISRPLGGRFDIHADWEYPHCDHRWGRGADVRTRDLTRAQRDYIRKLWQLLVGTNGIFSEADHWHVKTIR